MEINDDAYLEKDYDNEERGLKKMEVIQFYNYSPKKSYIKKYKRIIMFLSLLFLSVLIIIAVLNIIKKPDNDYTSVKYTKKNEKQLKEIPKKVLIQKEEPKPIITPTIPTIIKKNPGIAFLYPTITQFMVTTGEYFLKLQQYSIIFLTKAPVDKELNYNKKITRINAYYDRKLIENAINSEKISYLIINEEISQTEIKWLQSLGIKIIGVFNDIYASKTFRTSRNYNNFALCNAFIQDSPNDYNTIKKLNINKNIFIPNIYDTTKTQLSSLNNHNIILLGRLNNNAIITAINAMASIVKQVPDAKLNIISPDSQTLQINQLLKKLELNKNVFFVPFDTSISYYCKESSIFIYSSLIPESPMAINEAMDHGLPCIISIDIAKDLFFKDGLIQINMDKDKDLANEVTKLLKDSKYKNKVGMAAKLSLGKINDDALALWDKLFLSLKNGEKDFQQLRTDNENKYTSKEIPKKSSQKNLINTNKIAYTPKTQIKNQITNIEKTKNEVKVKKNKTSKYYKKHKK